MSEPWFDANVYSWIPGTILGIVGGLVGTLSGVFAPSGKYKRLVFGLMMASLTASGALLAAGIVALAAGQPYGIWYGLGFSGLLGLLVIGPLVPVLSRVYREAENRRIAAQDLD